MICVLAWAAFMYFGEKKDVLKIDLETGDKIAVTFSQDYTEKYELKMTSSALFVEKEKQELAKIVFVKEQDWSNHVKNSLNNLIFSGELTNNYNLQSTAKGSVRYTMLKKNDENTIAAWLVGSNTGCIIYGNELTETELNKLFKAIVFQIDKTEQSDNRFYPNINVDDKNNQNENVVKEYDFSITIDDKKYIFPYSYNELKENGWVLQDMNEEVTLKPDETSQMLNLVNEKYGIEYDSFAIVCQFKNLSNATKSIFDCEICYVSLDAASGMKLNSTFPTVILNDGIGFKSTESAVREKYGKPVDEFSNDYCSVLTYQNDEDQFLQFVIYDDYGVVGIELQDEIELLQ